MWLFKECCRQNLNSMLFTFPFSCCFCFFLSMSTNYQTMREQNSQKYIKQLYSSHFYSISTWCKYSFLRQIPQKPITATFYLNVCEQQLAFIDMVWLFSNENLLTECVIDAINLHLHCGNQWKIRLLTYIVLH